MGYRGDIGYQTILYCSETDIRNVLSFLIEKLPKEHAETPAASEVSNLDRVMKSVSLELASQLSKPWIPPRYRSLVDPLGHNSYETVEIEPTTPVSSQADQCPSKLSASIINYIALMKVAETMPATKKQENLESFKGELAQAIKAAALLAKVAGKKRGKAVGNKPTDQQNEIETEQLQKSSAEEVEKKKKEEAERLRQDLLAAKEELNALLTEVSTLGLRRQELEKESENLVSEIEKLSEDVKSRQLIASLLDNKEESLEKLKNSIATRRAKIEQLKNQWLDLKAELEAKLDDLTGGKEAIERQELEKRLNDSETNANAVIEEISVKEEQLKNLEAELEKSQKDVTRSTYTSRIIDMINNTKKQKKEIERIATDTRMVQKEMNSLNDKVGRAFQIADELVFKDSKRDETARKLYRILAGMHSDFAGTVEAIDKAATLSRQLDDTETQVDNEAKKNWQERAEKIAVDLKALRTGGEVSSTA